MILRWTLNTSLCLLALSFCPTSFATETLPLAAPQDVGFNAERLSEFEGLIEAAVEQEKMPGCVVCFGRQGKLAYMQAFGAKQLLPDRQPATVDTVYDLASLTKPIATATSIVILIDKKKLSLNDKVVDYLPEFGKHGKEEITIEQLLIHQSGLIPDNALKDYLEGPEVAWEKICELELIAPVGTVFKYSDVNFIVLGKLVEKISGLPLDQFAERQIFEPLRMTETSFNPELQLRSRTAPTTKREDDWIRGQVHDPRSFAMGGVAGHAGLFSTASDLAIYAQTMLDGGILDAIPGRQPVRILSVDAVGMMTRNYQVSGGIRGLGWDKQTGFSSNKGTRLSNSAFGHGGFTGTVLWIDPELDMFFIFLSNRVHPDGSGNVNALAGQILDVVVDAIQTK